MNVFRPQLIVWAALLNSVFVEAVVAAMITPEHAISLGMVELGVVMVVGLALVGVGQLMFRTLLRKKIARLNLQVREVPNQVGEGNYREAVPTRRVLVDPPARALVAAASVGPLILSLALCELPAIVAIALVALGEPLVRVAPLFAMSALGIAARIPLPARVMRVAAEHHRASL